MREERKRKEKKGEKRERGRMAICVKRKEERRRKHKATKNQKKGSDIWIKTRNCLFCDEKIIKI